MKKMLLSTVALVALGATVPALAADLGTRPYTKAPAYVAPIYNWTGFYVGGHIGGAFGGDNGFAGTTNGGNNGSFLGGLQAGADYQFAPNWVAGIEGQYSWLGNNNNSVAFTGAGTGFAYNNNQRGLGSVTGRLGYTWGPALLYAKGGYAYSDYNQSLTFGGVPQAFALNGGHHDGYTVGAGLEYMFAQNWSAKIEYQYYDFGRTSFVTPALLAAFGSTRSDEHTVKAGLNYRFNWGGPVVAKY
ncbi:outer membrane protein [Bradyrhizobium sp.]|jgi:outer membrane immunogenic protein|uniref:outer membrane protein n=1 Tax=Bradyrhizobium sp. TaxID=376 RepID=UPI003C21CF25